MPACYPTKSWLYKVHKSQNLLHHLLRLHQPIVLLKASPPRKNQGSMIKKTSLGEGH